jgi:hypothetical protein
MAHRRQVEEVTEIFSEEPESPPTMRLFSRIRGKTG